MFIAFQFQAHQAPLGAQSESPFRCWQAAEKLRTIHEITRSSTKRNSQFELFRVLSWIVLRLPRNEKPFFSSFLEELGLIFLTLATNISLLTERKRANGSGHDQRPTPMFTIP